MLSICRAQRHPRSLLATRKHVHCEHCRLEGLGATCLSCSRSQRGIKKSKLLTFVAVIVAHGANGIAHRIAIVQIASSHSMHICTLSPVRPAPQSRPSPLCRHSYSHYFHPPPPSSPATKSHFSPYIINPNRPFTNQTMLSAIHGLAVRTKCLLIVGPLGGREFES